MYNIKKYELVENVIFAQF